MATWPVGLPQFDEFLDGSFTEETPNNVIRTQMEVGPPKVRMRSTTAPRIIRGTLYMTGSQVATHDTFYTSTVDYGATQFDTSAPRTGASENFRYLKPPVYKPVGQGYHVTLELEMLP